MALSGIDGTKNTEKDNQEGKQHYLFRWAIRLELAKTGIQHCQEDIHVR